VKVEASLSQKYGWISDVQRKYACGWLCGRICFCSFPMLLVITRVNRSRRLRSGYGLKEMRPRNPLDLCLDFTPKKETVLLAT
jgi:hypothetical protein